MLMRPQHKVTAAEAALRVCGNTHIDSVGFALRIEAGVELEDFHLEHVSWLSCLNENRSGEDVHSVAGSSHSAHCRLQKGQAT